MRYFIRQAKPLDIERVAEIVGDNAGEWCGSAAAQAVERLHNVWKLSTRVWLTLDLDGWRTSSTVARDGRSICCDPWAQCRRLASWKMLLKRQVPVRSGRRYGPPNRYFSGTR